MAVCSILQGGDGGDSVSPCMQLGLTGAQLPRCCGRHTVLITETPALSSSTHAPRTVPVRILSQAAQFCKQRERIVCWRLVHGLPALHSAAIKSTARVPPSPASRSAMQSPSTILVDSVLHASQFAMHFASTACCTSLHGVPFTQNVVPTACMTLLVVQPASTMLTSRASQPAQSSVHDRITACCSGEHCPVCEGGSGT